MDIVLILLLVAPVIGVVLLVCKYIRKYLCCGHDWKLIKKYEVDHTLDGKHGYTSYHELYQCSRCKKFKKIGIKY